MSPSKGPEDRANLDATHPDAVNPKATFTTKQIQARTSVSKRLWTSVGECVSVLMRTSRYRRLTLAELEALIVPPLTTGQFLIAESLAKNDGIVRPVAIVLWAQVSDSVDARLCNAPVDPPQIAAHEWKSGENFWIMVLAGDDQVCDALVRDVQTKVLKGRSIKHLCHAADGRWSVATLPRSEPSA